jgi:hypothetical protein
MNALGKLAQLGRRERAGAVPTVLACVTAVIEKLPCYSIWPSARRPCGNRGPRLSRAHSRGLEPQAAPQRR